MTNPPSSERTQRLRGRAGQEQRARFLRLHPLCKLCLERRKLSRAVEVDHVVPLFKGGTDDDDNKQALCAPCHRRKTLEDLGQLKNFERDDHGWLKPNLPNRSR